MIDLLRLKFLEENAEGRRRQCTAVKGPRSLQFITTTYTDPAAECYILTSGLGCTDWKPTPPPNKHTYTLKPE